MQEKYDAGAVESAAQQHWKSIDAYRAIENDPRFPEGKYYACSMLPYPSGKLHMGHVRNYTINDVMVRHLRMRGFNVLMPMGWDAFGLPAENAAIKNKVAPAKWTYENIATMKAQMQAMGLAIDWSREVAACDPKYYKWNQWLFLKMLEKGVAYRRTQVVNWDPVDQTVLANEQVIDGRGWRTGALVEKREIPGYYLKITDYADELLEQVENDLEGWPERVRTMQANWIGKSVGVRFAFTHDIRAPRAAGDRGGGASADDGQAIDGGEAIDGGRMYVFTTRADTIMGVTFVAVAPEHPIAAAAAARDPMVAAFIEKAKQGSVMEADLATMEKDGVPTGFTVTHPVSGEPIEVWVGNYVLIGYGDGAVMGVPGHDERDFVFARKFGLPIRQVIDVGGQTFSTDAWQPWYADKGNGRCLNSGKYDGLGFDDAIEAIAADLVAAGLGQRKVQWRLRDWGISRQRYWGTPIPIIHCAACGEVPVPYEQLPVVLPEDLLPDGSGNPLAGDERFLACVCPKCGEAARRETDTMDTFVDSAWYYMRYCSPDNDETMVDARNDYWMPMDQYIGGIEHAVLHLLYARFWTRIMRDLQIESPDAKSRARASSDAPTPRRGLVGFGEPFTRLLCQGMVLNHIYFRRNERGGTEYFWPDEVENSFDDAGHIRGARLKSDGSAIEYGGVGTMSKSKNNGVDPQELIDRYGADTARLFVMFASPPEQTLEWSGSGVEGAHRFLRRLWQFGVAHSGPLAAAPPAPGSFALGEAHKSLRLELHTVLRQANYDYQRIQYNTVVSAGMKMLNALEGARLDASPASTEVIREGLSILLRVLYPVVPHIAHAMWAELGFDAAHGGILDARWPEVDEAALVQERIELVLQVNGKVRGSVRVAADADRDAIEAAACASEAFLRHAEGRAPKKTIVVPGRLVNLVV